MADELQAQILQLAVIEAAVDGIVIISSDGLIERFNPAAERIFGYTEAELLGLNVKCLMPEPDASRHDSYLDNYLGGGAPKIIGKGREVVGLRKSGESFPMELGVGEIRSGRHTGFVGTIRDLSERRALEHAVLTREQELHEARQRLNQVARVATLGEMASVIAHEINQPLSAIASYAQACQRIAKAQGDVPAEIRRSLNMISQQALRAGNVVRRIRSFVAQHDGERESADLNDIVRTVIKLAEYDLKANHVTLSAALAEDLPPGLLDPIQIQQIVLNLVRNATDAMEALPSDTRQLSLTTSLEHNMLVLVCQDSGPGVPTDALEQLFQPFHTTKENGMGMGLSISKSIAEAHDGTLTYDVDHGSRFILSLPILSEVL